MRFKVKMALLAVSTGAIALEGASCFFRGLGDILADIFWLGAID